MPFKPSESSNLKKKLIDNRTAKFFSLMLFFGSNYGSIENWTFILQQLRFLKNLWKKSHNKREHQVTVKSSS